MTSKIEAAFGSSVIQENLDFLNRRFLNLEKSVDFDFPPKIIDIHLGFRGRPCQSRCAWCYDSKNGMAKFVEKYGAEQLSQLNEELSQALNWKRDGLQIEEVHLAGGGEPTLFPKVLELIIDRFREANRKIWLVSNGIHFSKKILQLLPDITGVSISLNACDRGSYKKVCGIDAFDKVMSTLSSILAKRTAEDLPLKVITTYVFNEFNLFDLPNLIKKLNLMGVDEFRCRYDLFSNPNDQPNQEGKKIIEEIVEQDPSMRMKIQLKSPNEEKLPESSKCFSPFIWPTWNPLHGVFACAHVNDEKNKIQTEQKNGVFSLRKATHGPKMALCQDCHRRCPSSIHWFNLFLNNNLQTGIKVE